MIQTTQEAFTILDTQKEGFPFEAIRYLYDQPNTNEITQKIISVLSHAYDETYYNAQEDWYYPTPLWYAIIAENHLSEQLIDAIISLFTIPETEDWDFLNEQGQYVLGALAQRYPDTVMQQVMVAIDNCMANKSESPYLFLFDAFCYIDAQKYKSWFLQTIDHQDMFWIEMFIEHVGALQFDKAIPGIQSIPIMMPYHQQREDWETHYQHYEDSFYSDQSKENYTDFGQFINPFKNTGRNDLCPCSSGKKFKKCCLNKPSPYNVIFL